MACINQSVSAGALTHLLAAVIAIKLGKVELSITFLCRVLTQLLTLLQLLVHVILCQVNILTFRHRLIGR